MRYHAGKINIISLGCSKNLIDSERLLKRLEAKGYYVTHNPEQPDGEWVVVNTCGFINDAKEESINMILELGKAKQEGMIGKIVVMGCLSERYMDQLKEEIPEVDIWYGKFDWKHFIDNLPSKIQHSSSPKEWERHLTTAPWSAYLKISEGCNRFCAFCAIPLITGRHTSRKIDEILQEVRDLVKSGVKEFNIIAQDLSSYGTDIPGNGGLASLIDEMAQIDGVKWIRLHYAYPADFPYDILDVMNRHENVCKYLDIALQHISDKVLTNMRRHITGDETRNLIKKIRETVPDIKLRTTLMVGFPGEDEKSFEELLDFVKEFKFDRMGAFAYSEEDDTYAAINFDDAITEDVKQLRLDRLMSLQEDISAELNQKMIGKTVKVLIDRQEGDNAVGRTQWDSPEVDPEVIVTDCNAIPGEMIDVEITDALPFELIGKQK